MTNLIKYEKSESLYKFLIDDFGLKKTEEKYYPESFGNFFIVLTAKDFSLQYSNDRYSLSIEISSNYENKWYALSFIKDLLNNPDMINADERKLTNSERVQELNSFLKKDFNRISEFFTKHNYPKTRKRLDEALKKQFFLRHPSARDKKRRSWWQFWK